MSFNPPEADKPARGGQGLISQRLINFPRLAVSRHSGESRNPEI